MKIISESIKITDFKTFAKYFNKSNIKPETYINGLDRNPTNQSIHAYLPYSHQRSTEYELRKKQTNKKQKTTFSNLLDTSMEDTEP